MLSMDPTSSPITDPVAVFQNYILDRGPVKVRKLDSHLSKTRVTPAEILREPKLALAELGLVFGKTHRLPFLTSPAM